MGTHLDLGEVAVHALANHITFMLIFNDSQIEKKDCGPNSVDGSIST